MNSKDIFNIVVELSKMQEAELVKHNKSLAEKLSNTTFMSDDAKDAVIDTLVSLADDAENAKQ